MSVFNNRSISLSLEDKEIFESVYNIVCLEMDSIDNDIDVIEEGANYKNFKALLRLKKEYKKLCSKCKKAINEKDWNTAKEQIPKMNQLLNDVEKEIKANKGNALSSVMSIIPGLFTTCSGSTFWIIAAVGSKKLIDAGVDKANAMNKNYFKANMFQLRNDLESGSKTASKDFEKNEEERSKVVNRVNMTFYLASFFKGMIVGEAIFRTFIDILQIWYQYDKDKKSKKVSTADSLNLLRNNCLRTISNLKFQVYNLDRAIKRAEKNYSK